MSKKPYIEGDSFTGSPLLCFPNGMTLSVAFGYNKEDYRLLEKLVEQPKKRKKKQ